MKLLFLALFAVTSLHAQSLPQLQLEILALQRTATAQGALIVALEKKLALVASNPALQIGPFVSVDPNPENGLIGPHITFKGANVHIVDGTGSTYANGSAQSGRGNLVIGYNAIPYPSFISPGERGASHMLIMGDQNKYTQNSAAGIVSGDMNYVNGYESFVIGGFDNTLNEGESVLIETFYSTLTGGGANLIAGGQADCTTGGSHTALFGGCAATGNPAFFSSALGGINGTVIGVNGVSNK